MNLILIRLPHGMVSQNNLFGRFASNGLLYHILNQWVVTIFVKFFEILLHRFQAPVDFFDVYRDNFGHRSARLQDALLGRFCDRNLKDWELNLLQDIYEYWPTPK